MRAGSQPHPAIIKVMSEPTVAMMMAMDKNKLIGKDGGLPWHIPGELAYFKRTTMGKPIIMGRKTFDSIGKPLPGRTNIVVTRNAQWQADGVVAVTSLDAAMQAGREVLAKSPADELMIIGGAGLCQAAMPQTQRLYLTVIDQAFEGDTWLSSFDWAHWQPVSESVQDPQTTGGLPVTYWVLERGSNPG